MIKYFKDGALVHTGVWLNNGGENEWDEEGSSPLPADIVKEEEDVVCMFLGGVCINIGEWVSHEPIPNGVTYVARTIETRPAHGRFVK